MDNLEKIRDEKLTEDAKMEMIADFLKNGGGISTVKLESQTGTLSDEDYAKVSSDSCVIKANDTQYFYKQYSASTVIRYGATPRLATNKVIFDYIDIEKNDKTYEVKHEDLPVGA